MTDDLIERLDTFVANLLASAEGHDTSGTEDAPTQQPVTSLSDKVAVLKAVTAWIELRNKLKPEAPDTKPSDEGGTSEIVRLRDQLRKRERR